MSKQKKHPTKHNLEKLRLIEHKKEFTRRLKAFAAAYLGKEAATILTCDRIDHIYEYRIHTLKIVTAEGSVIPGRDKRLFDYYIMNQVKEEKIKAPDGSEVSFSDYLTIGISLHLFLHSEVQSSTTKDFFFCKLAASYKENLFSGIDGHQRLNKIGEGISCFFNDLSLQHYWLDPEINYVIKEDGSTTQSIKLHRTLPVKKTFIVDNQHRPAIKLGWARPHSGVQYIQIRPSELGIKKDKHQDDPMDIYIQSHALQRLSERLDCLPVTFIHFFVIISMCKLVVHTDNYGKIFIECLVTDCKAGYLVADIVDGCILIRTFLFLTNNGTPEGQKLCHLTGLGKLDKKYLAIDKLSAFISSDIRSNEQVMHLLRKSGCECLLRLHENIKTVVTMHKSEQDTAGLILNYIKHTVA